MTTAFDAHAAEYDAVAESALGVALRARVHRVLNDLIAPGDRVADLGCGSGLDAAWLAPQVGTVSAFDASCEMVHHAQRRCRELGNVIVTHADVATLDTDETFDVVLANFGVINCVGDLRAFGSRLAPMVVPGGFVVAVTMTRWCPVELAVGLASANKDLITRRRRSTAATDYGDLPLIYASARQVASAFDRPFELVRAESLGVTLPPFEQRHWVESRPRLRAVLEQADRLFAPTGARLGIGDHHIAVLRVQP